VLEKRRVQLNPAKSKQEMRSTTSRWALASTSGVVEGLNFGGRQRPVVNEKGVMKKVSEKGVSPGYCRKKA
jgi:hypothetical protein